MSKDFVDPIRPKKSALPVILGLGGVLMIVCGGGLIFLVFGLLFPAVAKIQESSERVSLARQLQDIGTAAQDFEMTQGEIVHNLYDQDNTKPLLSWRVQLLPYLGYDKLINTADMNKPWDDFGNSELKLASVGHYNIPGELPSNKTFLQAFSGPGAALDPKSPRTGRLFGATAPLSSVTMTDGTSFTIFVVESGSQVLYSQPVDLDFPNGPRPELGWTPRTDRFTALYFDGSTRFYTVSRATNALLTTAVVIGDGPSQLKD